MLIHVERKSDSACTGDITACACAELLVTFGFEFMENERLLCERAFKNASEGQDRLTPEDYKVAVLELLGYKPSKYEVSMVWERCVGVAPSFSPGLKLDTFVAIMSERLQQRDQSELIREVFLTMDTSQRGFLTESDCLDAFEHVVPSLRKEVARDMFREADCNNDGRISYKDFEIMMKSVTNTHDKFIKERKS